MEKKRTWPTYIWRIAAFIVLIVLFIKSMDILTSIRESGEATIRQLLNSNLSAWERLRNIWWLFFDLVILVLWYVFSVGAISSLSDFAEKMSFRYKSFLLWFHPAKRFITRLVWYGVCLIYYIVIVLASSVLLLFVSSLLVIGIHSMVPTMVSIFGTAMKLLFTFFSLDYNFSDFLVNQQELDVSKIFGNQSITIFVILFAYLIKAMTQAGCKFWFWAMGGQSTAPFYLKVNILLSHNYLRIGMYGIAFCAYIIQSSYKIMGDVNNIFTTFIIADVIFYTISSWFKGNAKAANENIRTYLNGSYQYLTEVERQIAKHALNNFGSNSVASVCFINKELKIGFFEKAYLYANKERRQRYLIVRKVAVLLKTRYANTNEILHMADVVKKHILNARRYAPNREYERMAVRLDEIKQDMDNVMWEYATSARTEVRIKDKCLDKQKTFHIHFRGWTSKDQIVLFVRKRLDKVRVSELERQYEQYRESVEGVSRRINEAYLHHIVISLESVASGGKLEQSD
ncbi:hypothetical protein SAMN02799630_05537 [Paenibacillus sp. UNCCL117]|uniref:hypothetical protein n=1 Tax=unclassified Paenibacillus TaxID=185978 RepID=UPI000882BB22|nr:MULTISPECIES: hypothetical protein [unclassified Paenibacillus]SDE48721.1 hypothetical protein SAMN04488602_13016 [Paenibacillus sp. cl123]SFW66720.1 hypothetical protein SAMN02799630_05537 [Paenibacillus sp. UNCCL117]